MSMIPTLAFLGEEPALAAILQEYAANAEPTLGFKLVSGPAQAKDSSLAVFYAKDSKTLDAHLKFLRGEKSDAPQARLLVLDEKLAEPQDEAAELELAGIFKKPVRLAALLDAGFSALRMAALKSPRRLSKNVAFNPFTRRLEDEKKGAFEELTPKEADLLLALLEAGAKGLTREAALTRIWHYHREADSHAVETATWRLRKKLESLYGLGVLESREGSYYLRPEARDPRPEAEETKEKK